MSGWIKLHTSLLNNAKLQALPAEVFRQTINIWCMCADNNGKLPRVEECAFRLRISQQEVPKLIDNLIALRLLDVEGEEVVVHDWSQHQREIKIPASRGTRMTLHAPTMEMLNFCAELHWGQRQTYKVWAEFRDYWVAIPGARGIKLDWVATWKNWCRRAPVEKTVTPLQIAPPTTKTWGSDFISGADLIKELEGEK